VVIEQILSAASDELLRFEQDHDEWVLVLSGGATLEIDGEPVQFRPGDWAMLPAGIPHSVVHTDAGTTWLAVHVPSGGRASR
jgi:cupin 2 domain-containing protein